MFRVEFSVVHTGCLVNETSRRFPDLGIICPGGFIEGDTVEEMIVLDNPTDDEVADVVAHLDASEKTTEVELMERTPARAFVRFVVAGLPERFCSQVVEKHHGFPIGMEIQRGGLEIWRVGCARRAQADAMLEEIAELGEVKHSAVAETSWEELLTGDEKSD